MNFDNLALGLLEQEIIEVIFNSCFSVANLVGKGGDKSAILGLAVVVEGGDCAGFFSSQCFVPKIKACAGLLLRSSSKLN